MAENLQEFSRTLVDIFTRMIHGFTRRESNYLSMGKIPLPQFSALEYLSRNPQCQMHDLARALNISRPAATGLAERLIRQGLARRTRDAEDRRVVWVAITPKGERILRDIRDQKKKMMVEVFGQIGSQDREHYLRTIKKVLSILEK